MKDTSNSGKGGRTIKRQESHVKPLGRNNFVWMAVAGVLIVVGFLLMVGEPSGIDKFNADIFSTRRIVIGPMLAFLGYVAMAVAIIIKPRKD
ncbi:MAG: DUF3098 domain-containing protein [Muribaculaceae bacterium]